jgi:predicted TIM-barrel fold metal-dependent hydrolase
MRIIALEEHYATAELLAARAGHGRQQPDALTQRLTDTGDQRVADLDAAGIDVQVLSLAAPALQELPAAESVAAATRVNDELTGTIIAAHPDRFAGFATLPTPDPEAAAAELERAVGLGLVGAMINGTTGGEFLDDPKFWPILETAARLDAPIYLHPGYPPQPVLDAYYRGVDPVIGGLLSSAAYGWHYECSLHVVRLIVAGVFDRLPGLKIIIGHLGEGLPFHLGRISDVLGGLLRDRIELPVADYVRRNIWATTAGYFHDGPFQLTREVFGDDRVLFSVDYPFADNRRATDWFSRLDLPEQVREDVAHRTAETLLRLPAAD